MPDQMPLLRHPHPTGVVRRPQAENVWSASVFLRFAPTASGRRRLLHESRKTRNTNRAAHRRLLDQIDALTADLDAARPVSGLDAADTLRRRSTTEPETDPSTLARLLIVAANSPNG